jgi:hypothetical protein
MSRSNPIDGIRNPATRWFEWAGGDEGGFVRWYDKDTKTQIKAPLPFTFLLLDELSTVKGWHDSSESGIYANEVRDTRQDVLVVKSFKGGELASGIYKSIKDRVAAQGGHYCTSLYLAYKEADGLKIGNLNLKGAAAGAWMEFKRSAPTRKDANGRSLRAYFIDAVRIAEFEQLKKGATVYRVPKFSLQTVSEESNRQAVALDAELQTFLTDYLKRPKTEAAAPVGDAYEEPHTAATKHVDDFADDIPWRDEVQTPVEEEIPF